MSGHILGKCNKNWRVQNMKVKVLFGILIVSLCFFIFLLELQQKKHLKREVQDLEDQISTLESQHDDLESRIDELEYRLNY